MKKSSEKEVVRAQISGRGKSVVRGGGEAVICPSAVSERGGPSVRQSVILSAWDGIHGCRNCIYDRKIYDSVVDILVN